METQKRPCTSCKVISVCCFCGIGGYLIYTARSYPKTARLFTNCLGTGSIGLGIGEIFNISPLRNKTKENS